MLTVDDRIHHELPDSFAVHDLGGNRWEIVALDSDPRFNMGPGGLKKSTPLARRSGRLALFC